MNTMQDRGRKQPIIRSLTHPRSARFGRTVALAVGAAALLGTLPGTPVAASTTPDAKSAAPASDETASAIFAGGCFWCMEKPFDELPGVISTTSGYTGGKLADPTYEQVSSGNTGHIEAVRVDYDPSVVSYAALVDVFWRNIDPLDARGQFCDKGYQYSSAIFYGSDAERQIAEESKRALEKSSRLPGKIETRIVPATEFYDAEDYHQDYYEKNPIRYRYYRYRCGRDQRLEQLWGDEAGGKKVKTSRATPAPALYGVS
ncbi:MAG: peptide-methionine (S)-S-oxide reductase MsrA [Candidatus Binatia bacterium]|nr:peptide-methionine (S)-S-oxide reductase MsrA [Candidatus Binatia bacterium]